MIKERITRTDIDNYKQQFLDETVLIGLKEAAIILNVNPRTLQRKADEGKIARYNDNQLSKGVRFLAAELKRYVREMREENLHC